MRKFIIFFNFSQNKHSTDLTCIAMEDWWWLVIGVVKVVAVPVGCNIPQMIKFIEGETK